MKWKIRTIGTLCAIMFVLLVSMPVSAEALWYKVDGVEGRRIKFDPETGTIKDCDLSVISAVIPEEINGVAVTAIGDSAFYCCNLSYVEIPGGVTSIESQAFMYCNHLKSIEIPEGVTSIGEGAFQDCTGLESIEIPEGVTSIGARAFHSCESLKNIKIPEGVTSIERGTFLYCSDLESIEIPAGITSIGDFAFQECKNLKSLEIPEEVTSIGRGAFYRCSDLKSLKIPGGVTSIGEKAFMACDGLKTAGPIGTGCNIQYGWTNIIPEGFDAILNTLVLGPEITEVDSEELSYRRLVVYNPMFSDFDFVYDKSKLEVIVGMSESQAETYAKTNGYSFEMIKYPEFPASSDVTRLFGSTRYETSFKVADLLKEKLGVEKFEAVIIATGRNFADALAGSYLAARKNAPILLTNNKNIWTIYSYIKDNAKTGATIYILGGEGAVDSTADTFSKDYKVKRVYGASRYETNLEILKEAGVTGHEIIVATGKNFADSLSASATKLPILLVKPKGKLNDEQKAVLDGMKNIYIVGGNDAVSAAYEKELSAFGKVKRISGTSRYDTSVEIAKTFFGNADKAVLANGKNFPDGLCGGPLAAIIDAPLILTVDSKASTTAHYVQMKRIDDSYVLGGSAALSDATLKKIFKLEDWMIKVF